MMNIKWLLCAGVLVVVGCGQNEQSDDGQFENKSPNEAVGSVYDERIGIKRTEDETPIDESINGADFFANVFDSDTYLKSRDRLQLIAGEEYVGLPEGEFKRASNELIYYRSSLVRERILSAWLLAADIENTLSASIIKKVERGEISISDAQSLLNEYSARFYSVEGIAKVFDEELAVKRAERFEVVETEILENQLGIKNPQDASISQRYAALFHHIGVITGGLENQVNLEWAGDAYGIVVLTELFNAHKNAVMASIYLEYLNDGGTPFKRDTQSVKIFREAIGMKLKSTDLVEFSGFGYTKITPQEISTFLTEF